MARVPGSVHTDLRRLGLIPDPFYGTNERDLQWIDKKDWEYETTFDVPSQVVAHEEVNLVFEGLDTFAEVTLNGTHILSADNMFRRFAIDVRSLLRPTGNTLNVRFKSPIETTLPMLERLGYGLPATNDVSEMGGVGDKKLSVFARKAPYHFGWDWGPRFVTSGIWKPAYIEAWSGQRIVDVYVQQDQITAAQADVTVQVEVEVTQPFNPVVRVEVGGVQAEVPVQLQPGVNVVSIPLVIENPSLWWSRGLGEPAMTSFKVSLIREAHTVTKKSVETGLRSIRVVREQDAAGSSFYFELNGVPVFAKGANHIPNDSFINDITEARYEYEILSAVASNMNMLRVWGGGYYEDDAFYDLCNRHGILVWQDFIFGCSMYPGDAAFLENVRIEATENVRRLRNHPCIAIWCGNNEMDTAWSHYQENSGWGWKQQYSPEIRETIWHDYEQVFHRILPDTVRSLHPEVFYWPSSPMAQWTNDEHQHASNESTHGDIHYWGVWHAVEPFENYNKYVGRFMSEYGFQSFPEEKTVRTYASEEDMQLDSDVMLLHQKNGRGNFLIKQYMEMYYRNPLDFPAFLYMSQIQQAEAIQSAIEAHRRRKPFCMGSLYWQMNDCWPVASWSSMDYLGRWKALQYYAARSYRDRAVSLYERDGCVEVYVLSDGQNGVPKWSGEVKLALVNFNGTVLSETVVPVEIEPNVSARITSEPIDALLGEHSAQTTLLRATLMVGDQLVDEKFHYFVRAKEQTLPSAVITVEEIAGSNGTQFALSTNELARCVWISSEVDGVFSDNFFDLVPGDTKVVTFHTHNATLHAFKPASPGALKVSSMVDYVQPM